jgi:hypothetical protein
MTSALRLNRELLRKRLPNIAAAARRVGLRSATISDLYTGKTKIEHAQVGTLVALAKLADCRLDELIISAPDRHETFAESLVSWSQAPEGSYTMTGPQSEKAAPERQGRSMLKRLPKARSTGPASPTGPFSY